MEDGNVTHDAPPRSNLGGDGSSPFVNYGYPRQQTGGFPSGMMLKAALVMLLFMVVAFVGVIAAVYFLNGRRAWERPVDVRTVSPADEWKVFAGTDGEKPVGVEKAKDEGPVGTEHESPHVNDENAAAVVQATNAVSAVPETNVVAQAVLAADAAPVVPVTNVVERPVFVTTFVDVPVTNYVMRQHDVYVDYPVTNYVVRPQVTVVELPITNTVVQPYEVVVEYPVTNAVVQAYEIVVEQPVTNMVIRPHEIVIEQPVTNVVVQPYEIVVERPVTNMVFRPYEVVIEQPVTNWVRRSREVVVAAPADVPNRRSPNRAAGARAVPLTGTVRISEPIRVAPQVRRPLRSTTPYILQYGDTIGDLAKKYGFRLQDFRACNPDVDQDHIYAGQAVQLPGDIDLGAIP